MTKLILITCAVTSVVFLGILVDYQSRGPAVRSNVEWSQDAIFASGRVEGASLEIELRPRLAGRIVELRAQEGQMVKANDVLLAIDDQQYRHEEALAAAKLRLAEAELDRIVNGARSQQRTEAAALLRAKQAELERAELAWKRIDGLREAKAVSQQEADNQRTLVSSLAAEVEAARARRDLAEAPARDDEMAMARARIEAEKAQWELAKVQLERTRLRAPIAGQILAVDARVGELAGPDSPKPAVTMADTTTLRVRAFVEELDAPRVAVGMTARIVADGLPDREFHGRVTQLSPRMSRKELWSDRPAERFDTKTREIWIDLDEIEGLVVGLRVDVTIDAPTRKSVSNR
jgi:HlyD family secretion protein